MRFASDDAITLGAPALVRRRLLGALLLATATQSRSQTTALQLLVPPGALELPAQILAEATCEPKAAAQPCAIELRPTAGKGSYSAAAIVARSQPQQKMLLMGSLASHALAPWLNEPTGYDALSDFRPLLLVARAPHVLVITPAAAKGMRNPFDLLRQLRAKPHSLRCGSSGWASLGHIAAQLFAAQTGLALDHLPFQGPEPAMAALLSGSVDMAFAALPTALPLIRSGRLQALGVTTLERSPLLPHVASLNDVTGNFNLSDWCGLFAPATLSADEASRYAEHFFAALQAPRAYARLQALGIRTENLRLDDFARFVQSEHRKYGLLIQALQPQP